MIQLCVECRAQCTHQGNQSWTKNCQAAKPQNLSGFGGQAMLWEKDGSLGFYSPSLVGQTSRFNRWHRQLWFLQGIYFSAVKNHTTEAIDGTDDSGTVVTITLETDTSLVGIRMSPLLSPPKLHLPPHRKVCSLLASSMIFTRFLIIRQVRQMVSDGSGGKPKLGKKKNHHFSSL